jgi:hypothetical protein
VVEAKNIRGAKSRVGLEQKLANRGRMDARRSEAVLPSSISKQGMHLLPIWKENLNLCMNRRAPSKAVPTGRNQHNANGI